MNTNEIDIASNSAVNKAKTCNNNLGKYLLQAVIAGFYIVVATILSNVSGSVLLSTYPQFGKLLSSFLFSIAIVLIVFIGGELFTGNNMTMALGVYNKKCSVKDMLKVWLISYIGNFIGAFVLSAIFVGSGASRSILIDYYNTIINGKLSLSCFELFLRGVLCNFMVCLAVWAGIKMNSESGKLIVMFCIIMTFVVAGFEHCIANMGTFSIASMLLGGLDYLLVAKSMLFVTLGNIVGGAVLLSGVLYLTRDKN